MNESLLVNLPKKPGVYHMLDNGRNVIYVGKAKNLKNRVSSYFKNSNQGGKTKALVSHIVDIEVIVTANETEALLLECEHIKKFAPKYNVILRDDKSYPYIHLSRSHAYPRISIYRGARKKRGEYFGPYPSAGAAKESIAHLQKLFKLRPCRDSYFKNRTRPCLEYQINRCSGPCVAKISKEDYAQQIDLAIAFLKGKSKEVMAHFLAMMDKAAQNQAYEEAAFYRDALTHLRKVQEVKSITGISGNADVLAVIVEPPHACVNRLVVVDGKVTNSYAYYPKLPPKHALEDDILNAFIGQYYLMQNESRPEEIITDVVVSADLVEAINQTAKKPTKITAKPRGVKKKWLEMSRNNASTSLKSHLALKENYQNRINELTRLLDLTTPIMRMECFDISHTHGSETVASCVVFDATGPQKSHYRKFNIKGITASDDYAAIYQAVKRRFKRLVNENTRLPEVLFIDGGKGQVSSALKALDELDVDVLRVVGVAKGTSRKPGLETLVMAYSDKSIAVDATSEALHLIQQIRDEAHRFAITGHRQKREKKAVSSVLEDIEGIGSSRRQAMLKWFGGLANLKNATAEDIAKVPGISPSMAKKVYDFFNDE